MEEIMILYGMYQVMITYFYKKIINLYFYYFLLHNIMNYRDYIISYSYSYNYIISYSYNYIIYLIYKINSDSTHILNQYGGFNDL